MARVGGRGRRHSQGEYVHDKNWQQRVISQRHKQQRVISQRHNSLEDTQAQHEHLLHYKISHSITRNILTCSYTGRRLSRSKGCLAVETPHFQASACPLWLRRGLAVSLSR
jgi:hypothetical protein